MYEYRLSDSVVWASVTDVKLQVSNGKDLVLIIFYFRKKFEDIYRYFIIKYIVIVVYNIKYHFNPLYFSANIYVAVFYVVVCDRKIIKKMCVWSMDIFRAQCFASVLSKRNEVVFQKKYYYYV